MDIIQRGSQYHLSPIYEATRKDNLSTVILHGNHKSAKTNLNFTALEKSMGKKVENDWAQPLTIELFHHINNVGVVLLGVADQFSINEKSEIHKKRRVTHD